jgi:hypothetical protein
MSRPFVNEDAARDLPERPVLLGPNAATDLEITRIPHAHP